MTESFQEEDKNDKRKASSIRYQIMQCNVCGSFLLRMNKSRHERTKEHKDANYLWHEILEINKINS